MNKTELKPCWLRDGCPGKTASCFSEGPTDNGCPVYRWFRDLFKKEQEPIGGWISVKDRLPENETEVIIIVQHKIGWYRAFAWHDEYGWHSSAEEFGDGESDFVTYWMPLPEPPKEVSGDS